MSVLNCTSNNHFYLQYCYAKFPVSFVGQIEIFRRQCFIIPCLSGKEIFENEEMVFLDILLICYYKV